MRLHPLCTVQPTLHTPEGGHAVQSHGSEREMDPIHRRATSATAIMSMKMSAHARAKEASQKAQQKRTDKAAASSDTAASSRPKPRRPPSAYSLFFKQERKKRLGSGAADDSANGLLDRIIANGGGLAASGSNGNASSDDEGGAAGKKRPLGASPASSKAAVMNELAKTVSRKWKALDESSRSVFEALALLEKKKYERQTEIWNRERKVDEERQAKKFGNGAGAKTFKELTAPVAAKRRRDEGAASADKAKKKPKSSSVCMDPLKSKQILPHMLGHGRRRFGVPKHVMDKAFSKSRGQQSSKRGNSLSTSKKSAPQFKVANQAAHRFGIQHQPVPMTTPSQKVPAKHREKKPSLVAVPTGVTQRERVRAARMKALEPKKAPVLNKVQQQPEKDEKLRQPAMLPSTNAPILPNKEQQQPEKDDELLQATLLPSIVDLLGPVTSAPVVPIPVQLHAQQTASNCSESAFDATNSFESAFDATNSFENTFNTTHSFENTFNNTTHSFESAFDASVLFAAEPTTLLQPVPQALSSQPEPDNTMDAIASVMELVRPLSGSGEAPAASALHLQAASASRTLHAAEEAYNFSALQNDAPEASPQLLSGMHDMLMLQKVIESHEPPIACDNKITPPEADDQTSPTSVTSSEESFWSERNLVEPTPLGASMRSPCDETIEQELNMSIADIFGVSPQPLSEDSPVSMADADVANILGAFEAATHKSNCPVTVEPNCIAQLQLRAQMALSSGKDILAPPTRPNTAVNQEIGHDDSPLDRDSIDFLMEVFH